MLSIRQLEDLPALVSVTTAAGALGVTRQHIAALAKSRKLPGARKFENIAWQIPACTVRDLYRKRMARKLSRDKQRRSPKAIAKIGVITDAALPQSNHT